MTQARDKLTGALRAHFEEWFRRSGVAFWSEWNAPDALARAALAVLEAHAAVVPREPTREMLRAMCKRRGIDGDKEPTNILDNAAIISMGESIADYRAMLSASPYNKESSNG